MRSDGDTAQWPGWPARCCAVWAFWLDAWRFAGGRGSLHNIGDATSTASDGSASTTWLGTTSTTSDGSASTTCLGTTSTTSDGSASTTSYGTAAGQLRRAGWRSQFPKDFHRSFRTASSTIFAATRTSACAPGVFDLLVAIAHVESGILEGGEGKSFVHDAFSSKCFHFFSPCTS